MPAHLRRLFASAGEPPRPYAGVGGDQNRSLPLAHRFAVAIDVNQIRLSPAGDGFQSGTSLAEVLTLRVHPLQRKIGDRELDIRLIAHLENLILAGWRPSGDEDHLAALAGEGACQHDGIDPYAADGVSGNEDARSPRRRHILVSSSSSPSGSGRSS